MQRIASSASLFVGKIHFPHIHDVWVAAVFLFLCRPRHWLGLAWSAHALACFWCLFLGGIFLYDVLASLYIPFVLLSCFFNTNYHSTTTTTIWKTLLSLVRILLFVSQIVRFVSDPKKKDLFLNNESRLQVNIIIQVWILWLVLV